MKLSGDGSSVVFDVTLASNLTNALDVTVGSDGTIYVAEWGSSRITYFKPDTAVAGGPTVTGITPNQGPISGGQAVTVTGTNFADDTVITIGGQPLANALTQNSTTITGTTPSNTAGAKDVVATHGANTFTLAGAYTFVGGGGPVPPVASAGPDTSAPVSHENHGHATLDGTASFDPDGATLTYSWTENNVEIANQAKQSVELTQGVHLITLTVTDADNLQDTDQVRVNITSGPSNLDPFFCPDINGDVVVNSGDQLSRCCWRSASGSDRRATPG